MNSLSNISGNTRKGQSAIEIAFMAPWIFFLFIGVIDLGFWSYQMICLENATRQIGIYASKSGPAVTTTMRQIACGELNRVINIPPATCVSDTTAVQLAFLGTTTNAGDPDRYRLSLSVPMTPMIPIPGLLQTSRITRTVEVARIE
jgi:Flp pilus assembly protein TadG